MKRVFLAYREDVFHMREGTKRFLLGGKGDGLSIATDSYSKLRLTTGPVVESV